MNTFYVIPNFECNLSCQHCTIHERQMKYEKNTFVNQLMNISDHDICILFGGEPTLFNDRFHDCIETNKIKTMSTNLLCITEKQLELLKLKKINIATSWNKSRFSNDQTEKWFKNLQLLDEYQLKCKIMITMTTDLIYGDFNDFMQILHRLDQAMSVQSIQFEHLIANDIKQCFYDDCDEWLCKIHNSWQFRISNDIDVKVLNWKYDCNNVFTLLPNGEIVQQCPHLLKATINTACFSCAYSKICKPCKLQKMCAFPKKLYSTIKRTINYGSNSISNK